MVTLTSLMPHREPVLSVLEVLRADGAETLCVVGVGPGSSLVADGCCPALCGLEIIAQVSAVHAGLRSDGGNERAGFLLRAREVVLAVGELPIGARMLASVRRTDDGDGAMASFEGVLWRDGQPDRPLVSARFLVRRATG